MNAELSLIISLPNNNCDATGPETVMICKLWISPEGNADLHYRLAVRDTEVLQSAKLFSWTRSCVRGLI